MCCTPLSNKTSNVQSTGIELKTLAVVSSWPRISNRDWGLHFDTLPPPSPTPQVVQACWERMKHKDANRQGSAGDMSAVNFVLRHRWWGLANVESSRMWECGKVLPIFWFFLWHFIQWFVYSGHIYVCIHNPYVHELYPVHIHMDYVSNYNVNKKLTNTARHIKFKPSICDLCHKY